MARLEAREPEPEPKRKKASGTKKKKTVEGAKSLQEEVEEFMNSGHRALASDDDLDPS